MVMTDHLIQRRTPPGNLLAEFRERAPEEYRGDRRAVVTRHPRTRCTLAGGSRRLEHNAQAGMPVLAREIARQKPKEPTLYIVSEMVGRAKCKAARSRRSR